MRTGSHEIAHVLLTYGASVYQDCAKKWTAMHEAAKKGHSDIMMLLLSWQCKLTLKDQDGVTLLGIAAENP